MANAHAIHLQMIQAVKRVLKACLDKLVIGILYDEGWNPLILNNRLCFSFQAIPDMELRTRAANSWNEYKSKFYFEFFRKWTLQGRESPAVEKILMSLRQEFKGPKWDMKVNKLISLSTEKRFRMIAEGKAGEAETLKNSLRKTVARITDYGLGDGKFGFEPIPATQIPQPKESKIGQVDEEVFAYAKKSTPKTDYGLGNGNVGFETTQTTQMPQPKKCKIDGQIGEGDFAYAKKSTPHTSYGLGFGNAGFESTLITQVPQPKENKTKGRIGEEVFTYAKKSNPHPNYYLINNSGVEFQSTQMTQAPQPRGSKAEAQSGEEVFAYARKFTPRTDEAFATDKPHPAKNARKRRSTLPTKSNHSGTGGELSGESDPDVVFVHTRKRAANPRTKRKPAISIPSIDTGSHFAAAMAEPVKETTGPLETTEKMAIEPEI